MAFRFRVSGVDQFLRRLEDEIEGIHTRASKAVEKEAEGILADTNPPVKTGMLRDSGRVESEQNENEITSSVVYGGVKAPHAPFVHEMPGEGHKFLERAMIEAEGGMNQRLSERIKK